MAVTYLAMIVVNALANILPINGTTTGDVSNSYVNLFAPAALTFSIWGLIYFLLAAYVLYQFGFFQRDGGRKNEGLFIKIGNYFWVTSVANLFWIFSWHYHLIGISVLFMLVILFYLIKISLVLREEKLSIKETFFIKAPFSVYFGWITVATIANITTYLVSLNWNGFGLSNQIWMLIVLLIGLLIGSYQTIKDRNICYGLVIVWAYLGILIKHLSVDGFNGKYLTVIYTVSFCLVILLISIALAFSKKWLKK